MTHRYPSLPSTMTVAASLPVGDVVVADEQTSGQGRHGHAWHSEAGTGLYCSIVLRPHPVLTLALGLAAAEAIGLGCDLRWPNDVMLEGKKVAGILVHLVEEKAIAGIGINVNNTLFPPEIEATSMRIHAGRVFDRDQLLETLLRAIDTYIALDRESILRLFTRASSYASGRRVVVQQPGGDIAGITAGLNSEGFLIVRKDDGTDTLILAGGVRAARS